jgi:transposase
MDELALARSRRGRPRKLTAKRQKAITEAIRLGARRDQAAEAAGIARSTLQNWIARGELDGRQPHKRFAEAVRTAEAEFELESLRAIEQAAAGGDWRAKAWVLERRHPERWGRQTRHEVTGPDGQAVEVQGGVLGDLRKLSEQQLDQLAELLERTHG